MNVRLRLTSFGYKPPLFSYGNCAWKILVKIRTTWFTPESRKGCIKTRSTSTAFPSNWNWETQVQAVRMRARTQSCSKEQVTYTSANRLKWSEYRQNSMHFYHSISPHHLFALESLHLFVSISNFLGLLHSVYAWKSPFISLSVNIL